MCETAGKQEATLLTVSVGPARHTQPGKTSLKDAGGTSPGTQPVVLPSNRLCSTVYLFASLHVILTQF